VGELASCRLEIKSLKAFSQIMRGARWSISPPRRHTAVRSYLFRLGAAFGAGVLRYCLLVKTCAPNVCFKLLAAGDEVNLPACRTPA
jgi:hypothetical protein